MNTYARKAYNHMLWLTSSGSPLRFGRKYFKIATNLGSYLERRRMGQSFSRKLELAQSFQELKRDGYTDLSGEIDQELLRELLAEIEKKRGTGKAVQARSYWEQFVPQDELSADSIFVRFALQPKLLELASVYLGQVPKLSNLSILHTNANPSGEWEESQLWHRDYNDNRMLKLFVYLTDVENEDAGPFTFIPLGASKNIKNDHIIPRRITDQRMAEKGGARHIKHVLGSKGTSFYIDTYGCYHLGSRCKSVPRLAFIATYTSIAELWQFNPNVKTDGARLSPLQKLVLQQT